MNSNTSFAVVICAFLISIVACVASDNWRKVEVARAVATATANQACQKTQVEKP